MAEGKQIPLWFSPICDLVLARLEAWNVFYNHEPCYTLMLPIPKQNKAITFDVKVEVFSTCKFMDGAKGVIDKPTSYIHSIPWTKLELDHLDRIVNALRPNSPESELVKTMRDLWMNPKGTLLSGGYKVLELPCYPEAIGTLLGLMLEVKNGPIPVLQREQGKDLFEA